MLLYLFLNIIQTLIMEKNFSAEPIVVLNRRILAQLAMPNYTITEISREDLPKLRDLYNRSDPSTILGYGVIENYLRWFQLNPDYNDAKFYCLNENWTDGTFIALVRSFQNCMKE